MLTPEQANVWQATYNASYYVLLIALFVSFLTTGLTFVSNNILAEDLTERLAQTTTSAGQANERAANLEKESAEISSKNLETEGKLETERLKRVALEAQFAWRNISPYQKFTLQQLLKKQTGFINIDSVNGDQETTYFAMQIASIFKGAGWKVNSVFSTYPGAVIFGIIIRPSESGLTSIVADVFTKEKLQFKISDLPNPSISLGIADSSAQVSILIGAKIPTK